MCIALVTSVHLLTLLTFIIVIQYVVQPTSLLFLGMEAEVLEEERLAGFEIERHLAGDHADTVGGEGYVFVIAKDVVEPRAEMIDQRTKAH